VMAVPYVFQGGDASPNVPGGWAPPGWQSDLWTAAFFLGLTSFVLALVTDRHEYRRGSSSGQGIAALAIVLAIVGAFVWALPVVLEAGSGL